MSVALYERAEALSVVEAWLMESGGEPTPEIEELLSLAKGDFEEKAERVALKIRELEATAKTVKEEADRLAARHKAMDRSARSLKEYLRQQMDSADRPELKSPLVTLRVHDSPPSARCTGAVSLLPPQFVRVVPERYEFNAVAALAAYRAGKPLPAGVEIVQGRHLRLY